jgi:hypothetical protein
MGSIKSFEDFATINWIDCFFEKKDQNNQSNQINDNSFVRLCVIIFYGFLLFTILALYNHNYRMNLYTKILNSNRGRYVFLTK